MERGKCSKLIIDYAVMEGGCFRGGKQTNKKSYEFLPHKLKTCTKIFEEAILQAGSSFKNCFKMKIQNLHIPLEIIRIIISTLTYPSVKIFKKKILTSSTTDIFV